MITSDEQRANRFASIWSKYPEKKGKHQAWLKFKKQVVTDQDWLDILRALENYKNDMARIRANGHPDRRWQNGATWFNHNWKDYIEYKPPESTEDIEKRELFEKYKGVG